MDEHEWLTSEDSQAMLRYLTHDPSLSYRIVEYESASVGVVSETEEYHMLRHTPLISNRQLQLFTDACKWGFHWLPLIERAELAGDHCKDAPHFLREIVGNPFREMKLQRCNSCFASGREMHGNEYIKCRECEGCGYKKGKPYHLLTPTVKRIAQTIYDNDQWEDMPILGDALEDAGCTDEDILNHCQEKKKDIHPLNHSLVIGYYRGKEFTKKDMPLNWYPMDGPHVRGCWVVDLILGLE